MSARCAGVDVGNGAGYCSLHLSTQEQCSAELTHWMEQVVLQCKE